jgi:hypothetical protein
MQAGKRRNVFTAVGSVVAAVALFFYQHLHPVEAVTLLRQMQVSWSYGFCDLDFGLGLAFSVLLTVTHNEHNKDTNTNTNTPLLAD